MRIGELAARTDTSRRLLRYYEEQGLIRVRRCANGYRDYDERLVDQVLHIRGLLDAGLPTGSSSRSCPVWTTRATSISPMPHRRSSPPSNISATA